MISFYFLFAKAIIQPLHAVILLILNIEYLSYPLLNTLRMLYYGGCGCRTLVKICGLTRTQNFGICTTPVGICKSTGMWGRSRLAAGGKEGGDTLLLVDPGGQHGDTSKQGDVL